MRVSVALAFLMIAFFAFAAVHASGTGVLSLPAGVNSTGVAFVNITNTISQSSSSTAVSNVVYTFIYEGSGTINLTLPGYVSNVNLLHSGQPYNRFSTVSGVQCSPFIPLSQQSCIALKITGVIAGEQFVLSYSYNTNFQTSGDLFNSTTTFIPFAPTALKVATVLPPGAFLQANPYYTPPTATFSSNGQSIEVVWSFYQNSPDISLPFTASYEIKLASTSPQNYDSYIIAAIVVAGIIIALLMLRRYREQPRAAGTKKRANPFTKLLNSDERRVLGLLKRGKFVGQKELISLTGFSKAKMSKIVSKLSRYKLAKLRVDGKYNKIKRA